MSPDARRPPRPRTKTYETGSSTAAQLETPPAPARRAPRAKTSTRSLVSDWVLSPYLAFLLLVGIGVATLRLEHTLRLAVLWLVLLGTLLLYAETGKFKARYSILNLMRGGLIGLVVALPFYILARDFFLATAARLYGSTDVLVLLERAVLIVPILEEGYFRGIVQNERGWLDGALLFSLAQAIYFVSSVGVFPLVILGLVLGMFLLGLLYGHVYRRYGLTASVGCHIMVSFVLLVLPAFVEALTGFMI